MVFGQAFELLEEADGWAFGYDPRDGYVGYVPEAAVGDALDPTHVVIAPLTHIYTAADIKSPERALLPFGAEVSVTGTDGPFAALATGGWAMEQHLAPYGQALDDWVAVAESFTGTPYLWGGNSPFGFDCSGLIQTAMHAAGRTCSRDSDTQAAEFPAAKGAPMRGDLVFWTGHVGIMADAETLLHANAHHMAVAEEPLSQAAERISAREFGDITKIARPAAP